MSPTRPTEFTSEMSDAFARAAAAAGPPRVRCFRIAGRTIRLEFAGPALEPHVTPALAHLAAPVVADADLTVGLWDTASTGVEPPGSHWKDGDYIARGEIRHELGDHVHMAFSPASGTFHFLDAERDVALFWVRRPERIRPWERVAPLRPLLGWWAESFRGQLSHGAAVGTGGRGVLLAGRGGSGKSTLALACLEEGMLYLGDDYVLLSGGAPPGVHDSSGARPGVHSLYCTAKLAPDHMREKLPGLCRLAASDPAVDHDKAVLFLDESRSERLVPEVALEAIVVPRISAAGRTAIRRASASEVLLALAPSSIFQLPGAGPAAFRALGEIVRRVPGFALEVGDDLGESVAAVRRLLETEANHAG